jgi:hypothetical protein
MPVLTEKRFSENLTLARNNLSMVKSIVQDLLIYGCYKAFKDGNTTPLNAVLDMAVHSKTVDVRRVTRWVEIHAGIARIKDEKFILNKKVRDESGVTDEDSFTPYETILRSLNWYDIEGKTKPKSVWDFEDYLGTVIKTLERHQADPDAPVSTMLDTIKELAAIKGKVAAAAI